MKTTIKGWAFQPNEAALKKAASERYEEIKHHRPAMEIQARSRYGENYFSGKAVAGLSPQDIALICDDGNTCFGGWVDVTGERFTCGIWND